MCLLFNFLGFPAVFGTSSVQSSVLFCSDHVSHGFTVGPGWFSFVVSFLLCTVAFWFDTDFGWFHIQKRIPTVIGQHVLEWYTLRIEEETLYCSPCSDSLNNIQRTSQTSTYHLNCKFCIHPLIYSVSLFNGNALLRKRVEKPAAPIWRLVQGAPCPLPETRLGLAPAATTHDSMERDKRLRTMTWHDLREVIQSDLYKIL